MSLLLVSGILTGGYSYYLHNDYRLKQVAEDKLSAIARLKAKEIAEWQGERLEDGYALVESPFFQSAVAEWMTTKHPEVTDKIRVKLGSLLRNSNYSNVLLVDVDGTVCLNFSGTPSRLSAETLQSLAIALREHKPILTDLHLGPESNTPELDLISPLYNPQESAQAPAGAVILPINPLKFLYPLIQSWPVPSQSAETVLIRRDGNDALYLDELRHKSNTALRLRIPLSRTEVPAVKAILGKQGIVEGIDYRGVWVLAFLTAIPDSPWFLVAKVDMDEALAANRFESVLIVVVVLGLLGVVLAVTGFFWQQAQRKYYQVSYELEQDRKRADEALRDSEKKFRSVVQSARDAIILADRSGEIILCNKGAETIFEYGEEEILGKSVTILMPERYIDAHRRGLERVNSTGVSEFIGKQIELHGQRKDGSEFPLELTITIWKTEEETFYCGILRDITERKRAEEELRETNQVLRSLIQASPLAIVALDYEGKVERWNPAAERIFGWSQQEVLGKPFPGIPKENQADFRIKYGQILQGQTITIEAKHQKKDGSLIDINILTAPTYDATGKVRGSVGVISDTTERKRAEEEIRRLTEELEQRVIERTAQLETANEELRNEITERKRAEETQRRLIAILEGTSDFVGFADAKDTQILYINRAGRKMTGIEEDEDVTKLKIADVHPEWTNKMLRNEVLPTAIRDGVWRGECAFLNRDGREIPVLMVLLAHKTPSGEVVIFSTVSRDITELKRAEEEIKKLNEDLKSRASELEASNKELEAFSYSVSHDLRSPLRAIEGFSRFLFEDYSDILDDEGRRIINVIRQNTQNMGRLIDDLLSFSRLGRQDVRLSQIDMSELARAVFEELKPNIIERTLQSHINALPNGYGDRAMIQQVFVNLFSNAIKFTKPKDVAVIEVNSLAEGEENIYYVRDNGVGFDMQYVGKLFGVFQRLHTQDEFEGTGVGLALVKRIINRHGGRVWAQGKVGEGATFYFTLPRLKQ